MPSTLLIDIEGTTTSISFVKVVNHVNVEKILTAIESNSNLNLHFVLITRTSFSPTPEVKWNHF